MAALKPLGAITAWDGIEYAIVNIYPIAELNGRRRLERWELLDPENYHWGVTVVTTGLDEGDPILCPSDWQGFQPEEVGDIGLVRWIDLETGAACVMFEGEPFLPPGPE